MTAIARRCGACIHFARHPVVLDMGQCSHSPPTAILSPAGMTSLFPPVQADSQCGQFEALEPANDQAAGQAQSRVLIDN